MNNRFLTLAALSGFITVAFGAFAAHVLQHHFSEQQLIWISKGWQYQSLHTLALLILGFFIALAPERLCYRKSAVNFIGIFWTIGIILFSFTLYTMALFNTKSLAMLVPIGGVAFLLGWLVLLWLSITGKRFEQ